MMRFVLLILMFVAIATQSWAAGKNISAREAKVLLDGNKKIFLMDVRTPEEFSRGRLPGAVLIPIGELERRIAEVPGNRTIVVYCTVGSRSNTAAKLLAQKGYRNVYNITYGLLDWYRNGFPLQR